MICKTQVLQTFERRSVLNILTDEAESSMKKQKREPSKEINETLTTKGKRGRKSKNLPKDEEVIVTTELLTVEPNVKGRSQVQIQHSHIRPVTSIIFLQLRLKSF